MSGLFRFPDICVKHDSFKINNPTRVTAIDAQFKQGCKSSGAINNQPVQLRDDHIILLAIEGLVALHRLFKRWRNRRRTLRALTGLDERQLQDIGLTRGEVLCQPPFMLLNDHKSYRALAELDETQLSNLSERGLQARREIRHKAHNRIKR
jgi:hypothetical protein